MPRKREHDTNAERIRAYRERKAERGMVRLELSLHHVIVDWLRREAEKTGEPVSEVVAKLVANEDLSRRAASEASGLWEEVEPPSRK